MESSVERFLTQAEEEEIVEAIRIAERRTSGELRVHIEATCAGDATVRAQEVFHLLKMDNTALKNGVLFYFATQDHKFSVIGDAGINAKVGAAFWSTITNAMQEEFKTKNFAQGIINGIKSCGLQLAQYFPWKHTDINELPDTISRG